MGKICCIAFLIIVSVLANYAISQNMVPNPGFEEYYGGRRIHKPWENILSVKYISPGRGYQEGITRTGVCSVALRGHPEYREFIQVKLTHNMKQGKTYYFEMYIKRSCLCEDMIKALGISFYKDKVKYSQKVELGLAPAQIHFKNEKGFDSCEWFKLSETYVATGGERYLSVGPFEVYDEDWFVDKRPKTWQEAIYYVDDVTVYEKDENGDPVLQEDIIAATEEEEIVESKASTTSSNDVFGATEGVLENVHFASNSAELLKSSHAEIDKLYNMLIANPKVFIEISGHTDNVGSNERNYELSEQRAKAVVDYLVSRGIPYSRVEFVGYGSSMPKVENDTEENRQKNRRVEFKVYDSW